MDSDIDQRTLNRTTLARQLLLTRSTASPAAAVGHLIGLQAQIPGDPYVALWSRLADFDPTTVSALIEVRTLLRMVVIRGTIHLVTADDAAMLRPHVQGVLDMEMRNHSEFRGDLAGLDLKPVIDFARPLLTAHALTPVELRAALSQQFPSINPGALALACRNRLPLVQTPPRGLWQRSGTVRSMTLKGWIGRDAAKATRKSRDAIVARYLRAFGPASPRDVVAWSRAPELGAAMEAMAPTLRSYRSDRSRRLFDLPHMELTQPDVEAPIRFLPEYDNLLLSHQDRSRFGDDDRRSRLAMATSIKGTVLVDGFVGAAWHIRRATGHRPAAQAPATLVIEHIDPLPRTTRSAVETEAMRLVLFLVPDAASHDVEVTPITD